MTNFIAEICSNHNGDLNRALALIDKAAEIGCAGVKFQLFRIDSLFAPEALDHPKYREMLHARRKWELPLHWLPMLKARCIERGIQFGVTPFYVEAVEELLPFVDFYKVASYSLLHDELLRTIARAKKPVILSTGMATFDEINWAVLMLGEVEDLTVLHCVSSYPASIAQVNPGKLLRLQGWVKDAVKFGWSDHTTDPAVIYYMTTWVEGGVIEFHLDLEGRGVEYQYNHCWLPEQIQPVIEMVKRIEAVGVAGVLCEEVVKEEVSPSEQQERLWRADPSDGLRPLMAERERLR